MENLTRAKAQVELLNKNIISHKGLKDVYVFLDSENNLIDNKGNILIKYEFWINRVGTEEFDDGWFILKKEKYSERFNNKDNEIVNGIFNPENWGKRFVTEEDDSCPKCKSKLKEKMSGVECSNPNCDYWNCL